MKILGIDPGNYKTGYSILIINNNMPKIETYGTIKSKEKPKNLENIFKSLKNIIENYQPAEIAIEASFYGKNPQSLIRLGEVRGVILLLSSIYKLPIFEYTPQQVKNAITGYGWSEKKAVSQMVKQLFNIEPKTTDEADAIAVSFCHFLNRVKMVV